MNSKHPSAPLVIIGGAEDKTSEPTVLAEFVRLAGGKEARIVVLPVASQSPDEVGSSYKAVFRRLGTSKVEVVQVGSREDANCPHAVEAIEQATGVFFTGGNQLRITSLLGGSRIDALLHRGREENGLVLAGTSAGATAMSTVMIIEGKSRTNPAIDTVENGPGMGFITDVVIDMHFAERGRLGRLLTAVAQHPGYLGIGIDENTAIVVEGRMFRVIGQGAVTILDASHLSYSSLETLGQDEHALALCHICLHNLPNGYQFDLDRREPVIPSEPAAVTTEQEHIHADRATPGDHRP